jgi:hypothetical protein
MPLLKSYVKEKSPSPPLQKVSLTGQVCAAGVNVRQHPGIYEQRSKKKEATVLVLRAKQTAAKFFCFLYTNMVALFFFQQDFSLEIKHMNRPLHPYMLEIFHSVPFQV